MSKTSINIVVLIISCVILYFISQQLVSEHALPSLSDYLASSTASVASSTVNVASSTEGLATSTSSDIKLNLPSTTFFYPNGSLKVFIANDNASREQGLSDVSVLPQGEGELFVFDNPGLYGFWMKNMNFPLDMIWIDSNKVITDITTDARPDSYPNIFMPTAPVKYVLEINSNSAIKMGLKKGVTVSFSIK